MCANHSVATFGVTTSCRRASFWVIAYVVGSDQISADFISLVLIKRVGPHETYRLAWTEVPSCSSNKKSKSGKGGGGDAGKYGLMKLPQKFSYDFER
jgi:hypothetical protein